MAIARKRQISLSDTRYYHCISRCVRKAYLCGIDKHTGQSYEHRREWVEDKIIMLASIFCIDVCAYAVMSNHTHIILHVDNNKANRLNDKAIALRWHKAFKGTLLTQRFVKNEVLSTVELQLVKSSIGEYRSRLMDISWFMRSLNEYIARKANKEDNCKGRFWEGRFKSQALLDESALVACMAYVDLNPIRAGTASSPENSNYTSIKKRIAAAQNAKQPRSLFRFAGLTTKHTVNGLPFELNSYLNLVDKTGRCIRTDKTGYIDHSLPPLLEQLNICPENWLKITSKFTKVFHGAVGKPDAIDRYCKHQHFKRRSNLKNCEKLLA
ncbi:MULTISPECIES: transposase [Pseudoalteromonas]|uniref:transposase n=1 Tax=Pseudoalteromonas TaxID=53246 RepID=UPI00160167B3|nr:MULTISPECIES: transposase [Pseudoalteromonas]MBB1308087.1 transposase [Pseudoalteromonas sp. SR41-8]MBB1407906.1 transposase [Pseudoalteromonas sp. SG44-17]